MIVRRTIRRFVATASPWKLKNQPARRIIAVDKNVRVFESTFAPRGPPIVSSFLRVLRRFDSSAIRIAAFLGLLGAKAGDERPAEPAISLEEELERADRLFDNGQFEECHESLKSTGLVFESRAEVLWRTSRALYQMANGAGLQEKDKRRLANEAYEAATEAMRLDPNDFAVHKWTAVTLDLKSACEGTKERIKNLENVKRHMQRAIELNPEDATTLYMLGEWCYGIADMPWYQRKIAAAIFATPPTSSYDEALTYFLAAEKAEPNFYGVNLLMLGKCYLKLGKEDAAKHYLILALAYPARTNDDHQANEEAREILKSLK